MPRLLYTSPPPLIILTAARLLAIKSAASACASAWAAHAYLAPLLPPAAAAATAAASAAAAAPALTLAAALASPYIKMSLAFGALSSLSAAVSRAIITRTVLRLEVEGGSSASASASPATPSAAEELLVVTTPRLLSAGRVVQRLPLAAVQGASANSTIQGFRVAAAPGARRARHFYLFPVEPHWRSEDLPALRRLLFAQYFREEEAAAAAAAVGSFGVSGADLTAGIAGFGPFRPAQFADPRAAGARALEEGGLRSSGSSSGSSGSSSESGLVLRELPTGLRLEQGTVWADFALPPQPTLEQRRAREGARKTGQPTPAQPLPRLPPSLQPPSA